MEQNLRTNPDRVGRRFPLREFHLLLFPPYFWLVVFFAAPMAIVVACSFSHRDPSGGFHLGFTLENYRQVFDPLYFKVLLRSILYATSTTAFTLLIAFPIAYYMAFAKPSVKYLLMFLVIVPFWTNFLIRMYSWMIILGGSGLINNLLRMTGLIDQPLPLMNNALAVNIGLVYGELPYMILPIFAALDRLDVSLLEASMDLGGNRVQNFFRVTFPLSLPGVVAGVIFVFIPTIGNFVVPDILGGKDSLMIGNIITSMFSQGRHWPLGSALSSVLTFGVMIFIALYIRYSESKKINLVEA